MIRGDLSVWLTPAQLRGGTYSLSQKSLTSTLHPVTAIATTIIRFFLGLGLSNCISIKYKLFTHLLSSGYNETLHTRLVQLTVLWGLFYPSGPLLEPTTVLSGKFLLFAFEFLNPPFSLVPKNQFPDSP